MCGHIHRPRQGEGPQEVRGEGRGGGTSGDGGGGRGRRGRRGCDGVRDTGDTGERGNGGDDMRDDAWAAAHGKRGRSFFNHMIFYLNCFQFSSKIFIWQFCLKFSSETFV